MKPSTSVQTVWSGFVSEQRLSRAEREPDEAVKSSSKISPGLWRRVGGGCHGCDTGPAAEEVFGNPPVPSSDTRDRETYKRALRAVNRRVCRTALRREKQRIRR